MHGAALTPAGPEPPGEAEPPLEERYFERRQIREAIAFAERGGIAVHRNLDAYDGRLSPRGVVMRKPFLHVMGLRPRLEVWGRRHGLRPEWIQPEGRRQVAHYDVFGPLAETLIARLRSPTPGRGPEEVPSRVRPLA